MDGHDEIAIRVLTSDDAPALTRLAGRDSAPVPAGRLLGASVDGRLVAAHSIATDKSIADPFLHTAEVRVLLAERARQLRASRRRRGLLGLFRGRPSRGALPASPPGAGGRLLRL
jgi:hypothetical protein